LKNYEDGCSMIYLHVHLESNATCNHVGW